MENNKNKNAGRPIEKPDRKKIGLSISKEANETLNYLTNLTGKTKSRIFEEALKVMKTREEIIYARMEQYEKHGRDSLLDFDELMKNKDASDNSKEEVQDVKVG